MIILAHPEWLLLIPVLLVLVWHAGLKAQLEKELNHAQIVLEHPDLSVIAEGKNVSAATARRHVLLNGLAIGLLVLALAQPQRIGEWIPENPEGREIVMLIDTSKTMSINDFEMNGQSVERLNVLKGVVSELIAARQGDHFGVIAFGTLAATLVPPTFDRSLVTAMIRQVQVGVAGDDTAIGDAVGLALKQLQTRPKLRPALILFTDGDNTAGDISPREAVELARRMGVPIYAVQIGDEPFALSERASVPAKASSELSLKDIASLTGGRYYRVGNTDALHKVVQDIGNLEKMVTRPSTRRNIQEWYLFPLMLAVGLFSIARMRQIRRLAI